jgi:eukaryotic-like serine/threonine-protein kinase
VQIYLDDSQAEVAAQKAIQLKSSDSRGYGILGLVHCRKGNWNEAVKCLQQAVGLSPQLGWIQANLAWALGKTGNWQKAEEAVLIASQLDSENPFVLGLQAWIAGNQQNWKPAIRSARQAIYKAKQINYPHLQKLQEWVYPCLMLALEKAVVTKQAGDVERCLQEFIAQVPNSSFAWGYSGWKQSKQGMLAESATNFDEASRKSGVPVWVLCDHAIIHETTHNLTKAAQAYEAAAQIYSNDAFLIYRLGTLLARQGDWLRAKSYLEKAVQMRPDYAEAYHNLGWVLLNLQQQNPQSKQSRQLRSAYSKAVELYSRQQSTFADSIRGTFSAIGIEL